ncbi:hypothetical protein ACFWTE_05340 [Nocardiopsis sp. NPDC058631]|uniref:hypothetical protein n=1 Tax=Nocardiopsis sp. NPDC058631 TaxID=3346566 RepID=UPI00365531B7
MDGGFWALAGMVAVIAVSVAALVCLVHHTHQRAVSEINEQNDLRVHLERRRRGGGSA